MGTYSSIKKRFPKSLLFIYLSICVAVLFFTYIFLGNQNMPSTIIALTALLIIAVTGFVIFTLQMNQAEKYYLELIDSGKNKGILQDNYEKLLRNANDMIIISDGKGDIKFMNLKALSTYGYSEEEALKLNIKDIRSGSALFELNEFREKVLDAKGFIFETLHKQKDGTNFPVEVSVQVIELDSAKYAQELIRDITEHKDSERKITQLNRVYSVLSNVNQMIVRIKDKSELFKGTCEIAVKDGGFRMAWIGIVDSITKDINIVSSAGFTNKYLDKLEINLNKADRLTGLIGKAIKSGQYEVCNDIEKEPLMVRSVEKAHKHNYHSVASFPLKAQGEIIGFINLYSELVNFFTKEEIKLLDEMANDISYAIEFLENEKTRTTAEKALRESEERYRTVYENSMMGIYRTTPDGKILLANPAMVKMLGYSSFEELASRNLQEEGYEPAYNRSVFKEEIERKDKIIGFESAWKKTDGTIIYVRENAKAFRDKNGKILYYDGIVEEITDRVKALEEINKLSQAVEQSPVSIIITDLKGNIEYVNHKSCELTGYKKEEIIGKNPRILKSGFTSPEEYKNLWETISSGKEWKGDFLNKKKDGTFIWESARISPILNNTGNITHYLAVKEDITEIIKALESIKKSEAKFRYLAEQSPNMIFINYKGKIVYVNQKCIDVLGYSSKEFYDPNFDFLSLIDSEYIQQITDNYKLHQKGKNVKPFEYVLKTKKGDNINAILYTELIDYEKDKALMGTAVDITERKKTEQLIQRSEVEFRSVWESSADAMRLCDEDGIILRVNNAYCKLFERSEKELVGQIYQIVYKYKNNASKLFRENVRAKKIITKQESEVKLWNGKKVWLEISNSIFEINNSIMVLSIFRDISERKKYEVDLRSAKEKAEEANKTKDLFLANMSHELRTPLIGILGFSDMLVEDLGNSENGEMAKGIKRSGNRLLNTLNLLLDLTRIESEKFEITITEKNILEELEFVYNMFRGAALEKKLDFSLQILVENLTARIDSALVTVILENLVNNAIKFTKTGSIVIIAGKERNGNIFIKVKDTGIGIDEKHFNKIFEEFRQVSEGINREFQGTGLGLAISKKYVEILKGSIKVESILGKGSTFTITLPAG